PSKVFGKSRPRHGEESATNKRHLVDYSECSSDLPSLLLSKWWVVSEEGEKFDTLPDTTVMPAKAGIQ
ncbi:MAG TPA: hypothetical protein PLX59_02435, partial [Candidatus Cloacimonadota bacterium]|nr:hypothetical protein [Candidatus Cloacimonadota bacterium]